VTFAPPTPGCASPSSAATACAALRSLRTALWAAVDAGCGLPRGAAEEEPGKTRRSQLTSGCLTGKAQVLDNADGVVLDHQVMVGNPPDAPLLAPAVGRVIARTGKVPRAVTADRGYGEPIFDQELADLGVARVAIPRRGRAGPARQAVERGRGFRRLVKWRTGCEGRISCLKHRFGWDRTRMDGIDGARIWCGYGVFANNLVKVGGLLDAEPSKAA
jgi:IS5 family transposase